MEGNYGEGLLACVSDQFQFPTLIDIGLHVYVVGGGAIDPRSKNAVQDAPIQHCNLGVLLDSCSYA